MNKNNQFPDKKEWVFATNNTHKLEEILDITGAQYRILSLNDIGCTDDIPETADTLEENALLKARYIKHKYGYDCFADDTGLEVTALGNAPGVYSARYAGEQKNPDDNIRKILVEMETVTDRSARFRTIIALIMDHKEYLFEGIVSGKIIPEKKGSSGFGYDPVFVPDGYNQTFAELGNDIKNQISHRAEAVRKLKSFLDTYIETGL